jgi:hypothetical protein
VRKTVRKIVVGGVTYSWMVGLSNVLIENRELGRKWTPYTDELIPNFSRWEDSITPSIIRKYIEEQTK